MKIPNTEEETTTAGLDGLLERCMEYYGRGARFTKWRCALKIDRSKGLPSVLAITENAHILARYAAISQAAGLVPIVEPEILMDGDHSLSESAAVAREVLAAVFAKLHEHRVDIPGCLLKCAMVCPGVDCPKNYSVQEIAEATVCTLKDTVPAGLGGIVFLSGGLSESQATEYLAAINAHSLDSNGRRSVPWGLSFSYGRALQQSVLKEWSGRSESVAAAQNTLLALAERNGEATRGHFDRKNGDSGDTTATFEKGYSY